MTNSFPKKIKGAATLMIAVILLFIITFIVLFAGNYSMMSQKITSNQLRNESAYQAAEAGLEFAIPYLQQNSATILANPVSGFIPAYSDSNTANVTLANNSKYTIAYSNPTANNYNTIKITVTGVSDDGSSTRVISQLVQYGGSLATIPGLPMISQGAVSLKGSAQVTNTTSNLTIDSSAGISFQGAASTMISTGVGSNSGTTGSDILQNDSALGTQTPSQLFQSYFGSSSTSYKSTVANYYNNSTTTEYSSLLIGKTATTIWIDQTAGTARITGSGTIGTAANPVILIVNGNLFLSGSTIIYGLVFQMGGTAATDVTGSSQIIGGLITTGSIDFAGTTDITYSQTVLNTLKTQSSYYAKIAGSWKDF